MEYRELGHTDPRWDDLVREALERQLLENDLSAARTPWEEAYDLGYRGYVGLECRPKTTELAAAIGVAKADVW